MSNEGEKNKEGLEDEDFAPAAPQNKWDRQISESIQAYEAFWLYCEMGTVRSHVKVATRLGKSTQLINVWSTRNKWRFRVYAWDCEQDRIRQNIHRDSIIKMEERHAKLARSMSGKVAERLATLDISELTPKELATWLKIVVQLERQAMNAQSVMRPRRGRPYPVDEEAEKQKDAQDAKKEKNDAQ
jgi:hypothetical protein